MPYKDKIKATLWHTNRIRKELQDRKQNPGFYLENKKICSKCKLEKNLMDFYPSKAQCVLCKKKLQAAYRRKNPILSMFKGAKYRAKYLKKEFTITLKDIQIPKKCPVLGIPLIIKKYKPGRNDYNPNSPSLDRIDNNKGYTPENIQVISYRANGLKSDASIEELKAIIAYMENNKQ